MSRKKYDPQIAARMFPISKNQNQNQTQNNQKNQKKQNRSDLIPIPSKLVNKIRLITTTVHTVQHRLRREYMRCQFHQDTHRYYDDMCIAFHQDAYNTIENLIRHKLNRPILYEIEREDEYIYKELENFLSIISDLLSKTSEELTKTYFSHYNE